MRYCTGPLFLGILGESGDDDDDDVLGSAIESFIVSCLRVEFAWSWFDTRDEFSLSMPRCLDVFVGAQYRHLNIASLASMQTHFW